MTFWVTALPDGGFAMGEAASEAEARRMIEQACGQDRTSVNWHEGRRLWRWTVVTEGAKSVHGWARTEREAWRQADAARGAGSGVRPRRPGWSG